uniref:Uncharacterized protein n=1 Tax=Micrurus spixii TaxID=129469 RepID=A0A2D4LDH6_9SAUR
MSSLRSDNMQALLQIFLCFVLLATGSCLQCETCQSNKTSCTGPMENCTEGDTCVIGIVQSSLSSGPAFMFQKSCGKSADCDNVHMHFDLGNGHMYHMIQHCCMEEACSNIATTLPTLEKDPKGKQCPACNSIGDPCKKDTVECSGKDTDCFTIITNVTSDGKLAKHTMKGCGSKNMCLVLQGGRQEISEEYKEKITCTFSGASQVLASFLTTFSSFWILKLLV